MKDFTYEGSSIVNKSLAQHVLERLEDEIITGKLKPGQKLREEELCAAWNVSRSPVREAFRILTGQGFLVMKPRRGTFVAPLDREEIAEVYEARACLESFATFLAVRKNDPAVLERLKKIQASLIQAFENADEVEYHRLNLEFHDTLVFACGNKRLISLLQPLTKQTQRYRFTCKMFSSEEFSVSCACHERLIELMAEADPYRAEAERKAAILSQLPEILEHIPSET